MEPGELIALDTILDEEYSGQSIEDIAEDIMDVPIVQYSEKKVKMYQAADAYFKALKGASSEEELQAFKDAVQVVYDQCVEEGILTAEELQELQDIVANAS